MVDQARRSLNSGFNELLSEKSMKTIIDLGHRVEEIGYAIDNQNRSATGSATYPDGWTGVVLEALVIESRVRGRSRSNVSQKLPQ